MHVTKIGGRTILQRLGDDLTQALGRKGVIRQPGQRQPLETDLPAISLAPLPDGRQVFAQAMEDRFDLMEVAMDPMHGVVLADVFAEIEQALRHDLQTQLLEDFTGDGVAQGLPMILTSARQNKELPFFGTDAHREDIAAAQDDGTSGGPNAGSNTAGLATRSGHGDTLPGPAGQ